MNKESQSGTYFGKVEAIISAYKKLDTVGLNRGASGNISMKTQNGFLITPSGLNVDKMRANKIVELNFDGVPLKGTNPSSEWRLHAEIYKRKKGVGAVVHTHSNFACALSSLRENLPAFHYMVAVGGGKNIRCCEYAIFGSKDLADKVVEALESRMACLMANHGLVCCGKELDHAIFLAEELEALCKQYITARSIGDVKILTDSEMELVIEKFKNYGYAAEK